MRLSEEECWTRLGESDHGVLATVHERRGVDAVPVVFALSGRDVVIPIDTVKAKRTTDLQRARNVASDPRCVLLVDHYAADWSTLWWVRVHGLAARSTDIPDTLQRFPAYRTPGAVDSVLVLSPTEVTGWTA